MARLPRQPERRNRPLNSESVADASTRANHAQKVNWTHRLALTLLNLPGWAWIVGCGGVSLVLYYFAFSVRFSLSAHGSEHYQSVATLNNYSADGAFLYVFAFIALFGLYWFGSRRLPRPATRNEWLLVGGFAVLFNVALLPMYPVDAADIYDNIIRGRMSAHYGLNPMASVPNDIPGDPFYRFAAPTWYDTSSAYGPAWEMLAALGSRIAGDDYTANVIVFKLIPVVGYALTAVLIGLTLQIVAPKRALTGFYLFAWNPVVVFMTAGIGHNDAVMTACMLLSLYFLVRRWYVASTLAMILGALVKFIPALLVPVIAIIAFRQLQGRARIRYLALSAVIGGLVIVLFYSPYWHGIDTLGINRRASLYTGSVATLVRQTLGPVFDGQTGEAYQTPNTNNVIKWAILGISALFYLEMLDRVYRALLDRDPVYPLYYLLFAAIWFQPWYAIWVVALASLLDNTPMRRLILLLSYLVTWQSFIYNYVTLRADGWAPLPWRDLLPIAITMGVTWSYIAIFRLSTWLRNAQRNPLLVAVGERLRAAREAARLSPADIGDSLNLRTDDLTGYERGDRAVPLDRAQAIAAELNVSVSALLGDG